jgi:hypothetical protein
MFVVSTLVFSIAVSTHAKHSHPASIQDLTESPEPTPQGSSLGAASAASGLVRRDARLKQRSLIQVTKRDIEDDDDDLVSLTDAFGPEAQTSQNMDPVDVSAIVRFKSLAARYNQTFITQRGLAAVIHFLTLGCYTGLWLKTAI